MKRKIAIGKKHKTSTEQELVFKQGYMVGYKEAEADWLKRYNDLVDNTNRNADVLGNTISDRDAEIAKLRVLVQDLLGEKDVAESVRSLTEEEMRQIARPTIGRHIMDRSANGTYIREQDGTIRSPLEQHIANQNSAMLDRITTHLINPVRLVADGVTLPATPTSERENEDT